jgi:hypothetical protein
MRITLNHRIGPGGGMASGSIYTASALGESAYDYNDPVTAIGSLVLHLLRKQQYVPGIDDIQTEGEPLSDFARQRLGL